MKNYIIKQLSERAALSIVLLLLGLFTSLNLHSQGLGALQVPPDQYALLPRPNWDEIAAYSNGMAKPRGTSATSGITMLNNPPIGNQGTEGSCVGWAVGYSAMSILNFPKTFCWDNARASASYVYNQIKVGNDCGSGSYPTDGLNLVKSQGDCLWNLMPYVDGDCVTQPNAAQRTNASQNKAVNWAALNPNDVDGIKHSLDLGFPVVCAFKVTQSFDQMGGSGGIWSVNTGSFRGRHATCIIGYDDIRQQFKVQNQWGNAWGDNGYYWVTYDLVRNNCYEGLYILYGNNGSSGIDIVGNETICPSVTTTTFAVGNLPCNSIVNWSTNIPQVSISPTTGPSTTLSTNGYIGNIILTAAVTNSSGITQLRKNIQAAITPTISGSYTNEFDGSVNALGTFPSITNRACTGYYINTNIGAGGSAIWQKISSSDALIWTQNGNNVRFYFWGVNQWAIFQLTYTTPCGSVTKQFKWQSANCSTGGGCNSISISPNPTNGKIKIIIPDLPIPCFATYSQNPSSKPLSSITKLNVINVYNLEGIKVKTINCKGLLESSFDLTGLISGSYLVETICLNGYVEKQLVVVKNK